MGPRRFVQIIVTWTAAGWVVLMDAAERGVCPTEQDALAQAYELARQAMAVGADCSLLVRDEQGVWREETCDPGSGLAA